MLIVELTLLLFLPRLTLSTLFFYYSSSAFYYSLKFNRFNKIIIIFCFLLFSLSIYLRYLLTKSKMAIS